jgi:hypothetical protein
MIAAFGLYISSRLMLRYRNFRLGTIEQRPD